VCLEAEDASRRGRALAALLLAHPPLIPLPLTSVGLVPVPPPRACNPPRADSVGAVEEPAGIQCVIYAAKSSADLRGSIRGQVAECRATIAAHPGRKLVGEYTDEAFSAYNANRGPGLLEAIHHAQQLAEQQGIAELWVQHSDRLARGDGRSARHTVEVALWALKHDVKIRSVHDPDTFRDLLYAVVTGQRNHEDSRRKGLASAAGRRRAVERGEYTGSKPDGYRRVIEVDENGTISRRLDIDPGRRPVLETIFSMAIAGSGTGEIARTISNAGWLTNPRLKSQQPKPWTIHCVRGVLKNARYAGIAMHNGEAVGHGKWPAYITEREYQQLQAGLRRRAPNKGATRREPYLLSRLASCGLCRSPMHCITGAERHDGTFARRYVCMSHHWQLHAGRCGAPRIDADAVETMFASIIRTLLLDGRGGAAFDGLAGSGSREAAMLNRIAASSRNARHVEAARRFETWATTEPTRRTDATRAETRKLNRLLRSWYANVTLVMDSDSVVITAHDRPESGTSELADPTEMRFNRREWMRWSPMARRIQRMRTKWTDQEILGALQAWSDTHGHAPRAKDWSPGKSGRPSDTTVRRRFNTWRRALIRAGLQPTTAQTRYRWDDAEIISALQVWAATHGYPPGHADWHHGNMDHPGKTTVCNHFGSWQAGLTAAGLAALE
jgi:DNA invertase Pin-like site-specific DNA recombinase